MAEPVDHTSADAPIVLVGNPNVGKSVLFGALTGRYVTVSNYPGTTVEVARGTLGKNGSERSLIDTPGIRSLIASSDDERVTRDIILQEAEATILLVLDSKNLLRGLMLAQELAETGRRMVVACNMADEAKTKGISVNIEALSAELGVPVISTVALRKEGLVELVGTLRAGRPASASTQFDPAVEAAISEVSALIKNGSVPRRSLALSVLGGDRELADHISTDESQKSSLLALLSDAFVGRVQDARIRRARELVDLVVSRGSKPGLRDTRLSRLLVHPIWGWPVLAVVLYLMYQFVGVIGAGTLVDFLEVRVFEAWLNPAITRAVEWLIPWAFLQDFLIGEYGAITMGLTYALAIVLPIVSTFFLAFSVLEDSGYLPRLAVMLDRAFRAMGLNGKAVLPMILGLGCDTMATMTTRILDTRKERLQVTLLLALGVPCSAQLGVILGMVAGLGATAVITWIVVVVGTLLAVGFLAARVIPGERSDFILELPPLRRPLIGHALIKTVSRVEWYLKEVVPVFLWGTAALFVLDKLSWLEVIERAMAPLITTWLGLPAEVTEAFLIGFLRRDYGAAGLFAVARDGLLDPIQITVSLIVMTLFMPCFANFLMIIREHGAKAAIAVTAVVFPMAFLVGGLIYRLLLIIPFIG